MIKMSLPIKKKIDSERGESIAEVLIAMLIIELALIMVVSMIMSSGKMITNSEKGFDAYYLGKNAIETRTEQLKTVNDVNVKAFPNKKGSPVTVTITDMDPTHTTSVGSENVQLWSVNYQPSIGGAATLEYYETSSTAVGSDG